MKCKTSGIFSGSALSPVVRGLRAKAATCLMFSFILRLKGPEYFLSAFLLSTTFSAQVFHLEEVSAVSAARYLVVDPVM